MGNHTSSHVDCRQGDTGNGYLCKRWVTEIYEIQERERNKGENKSVRKGIDKGVDKCIDSLCLSTLLCTH